MALSMTGNEAWLIIDAGGTYLKSVLLKADGTACASSGYSAPSFSHGTLEQVKDAFKEVLTHGTGYCEKEQLRLKGIGVSIPGPFDYRKGISLMKHKYQCLYGMDMRAFLLSLLQFNEALSVWFVHDVNAVLAGELWKGIARRYENVAVVTLGTGLGFACSLGGEIQCSELGSPLFSMYNRPFRTGILEDYVSQRGILRTYGRLGGECPAELTVRDIAVLAQDGDGKALEAFRTTACILADSLRPFLTEKRIECLLFGGQISRSFLFMEEALKERLGDKLL